MASQTNVDNDQTLTRMGMPMRRPGSKDKTKRHAKGSGPAKVRSGEMKTRFHDDVKARQATYPPMGNVSPMPMPNAMQSSGGMPQGEEMESNQGGGMY